MLHRYFDHFQGPFGFDDDRGRANAKNAVVKTSMEPHAISTGKNPPNPKRAVPMAGPPMRARLKRLCSIPMRAPCSSLSTFPVVCVVNPVAKTCWERACSIETAMTYRRSACDGV